MVTSFVQHMKCDFLGGDLERMRFFFGSAFIQINSNSFIYPASQPVFIKNLQCTKNCTRNKDIQGPSLT